MRRVLYPDSADPCNATCAGCSCTIELADIELIQSCEDAGENEFYTQVSGTYALTFSGTDSECCPEGEELNILLVLDYILEDGTTGSSEQVIYGPLVTDGTPTALPLYPDVEWTLTGTCQPIVSFTLTAYVGCGAVNPNSSFCTASATNCPNIEYLVEVTLDWGDNTDYDLYGKRDDKDSVYYGMLFSGGLQLNIDAHPSGQSYPEPPEIITGTFTTFHQFRFWYNQYTNATPGPTPTQNIKVTNTGGNSICVNGTTVPSGSYWTTGSIEFSSSHGAIPNYTGGTAFYVNCTSCA